MDILFHGYDDDWKPVTFTDWRALAEVRPWALLDADSFTAEERAWLVSELEPYADIDHGDSMATKALDPLPRFAVNNLPRLGHSPDLLSMAEQEAIAFIKEKVGDYEGLLMPVVKLSSTRWGVAPTKVDGTRTGKSLIDLHTANLATGGLYAAVGVLLATGRCREALKAGDGATAANMALLAGEHRVTVRRAAKQAESAVSVERPSAKREDFLTVAKEELDRGRGYAKRIANRMDIGDGAARARLHQARAKGLLPK